MSYNRLCLFKCYWYRDELWHWTQKWFIVASLEMLNNLNFIEVILKSLPLGVMCCNFLSVFILSLKNRPRCWAVTYLWTTNTSSPAQVTKRPRFMKSSTKFMDQRNKEVLLKCSLRLSRVAKNRGELHFSVLSAEDTQKGDGRFTPLLFLYMQPLHGMETNWSS